MPDELGAGADQRTVDQMMQELLDREHALEPPPVEYEKYDAEGKPTAEFLRRNPRVHQAIKNRQRQELEGASVPTAPPSMRQPPPMPSMPQGPQQPYMPYAGPPRGPDGKPFAPAIKIGPNGEIIWPKE